MRYHFSMIRTSIILASIFNSSISAAILETASGNSIAQGSNSTDEGVGGNTQLLHEKGIKLGLVTRSFSGRRLGILEALPCWEATLIGGATELVYVLDKETAADHALGKEFISFFRAAGLESSVHVKYEAKPPCAQSMFRGKLEGNAGKDRSQRSNFLADLYTNASVIGMFDAEVCFVAPVTPSYYIRSDFSGHFRLQMTAAVAMPSRDTWGVDGWALKLPTPIDVMITNVFPYFFWRDDLIAARRHLAQGHLAATIAPKGCTFDNAFDRAFAGVTNSAPKWGFGHIRHGYSQFNILANFVLHHNPSGYAFHVVKSKPEDVKTIQRLHSQARFLAADATTLGLTFNNAEEKANLLDAVEDSGGYLIPARNAEKIQGVVPIMRRFCCALHPSLDNFEGCHTLERLEATVIETLSSAVYTQEKVKAVNMLGNYFAQSDASHGNAGHCHDRPTGDRCSKIYENITRAHIASSPATEQARAKGACERLLSELDKPYDFQDMRGMRHN